MINEKHEAHIKHYTMYCRHYDASGITMIGGKEPHGTCKAGVVYLDQFGRAPREDTGKHIANGLGGYYESSGIFQRICCTAGNKEPRDDVLRAKCPSWTRVSREEAEAEVEETDKAFDRMRKVLAVISPWRNEPPIGKTKTMECPICKTGKLHLSQALNGHVHGRCSTDGCVRWME